MRVAFALDCHDREALGHVARARDLRGEDIRLLLDEALWSRFGERTLTAPVEVQWLSDNGGAYTSTDTVLYAQTLGFRPVTTPAYSPESNGMAEAFVNRSPLFPRNAFPKGVSRPQPSDFMCLEIWGAEHGWEWWC